MHHNLKKLSHMSHETVGFETREKEKNNRAFLLVIDTES
jgi:hypothetical protein